MSDSEAPPVGSPDSVPPDASERAPGRESRRRRLEGVIPEIVRRAVELGVEKAQEAPDNLRQLVNDLKLPKEVAHYLLGQIDETKNGLFRVVAKEIRDFLEHTNFAGEMQKLLTTVQFEVNTTIRFSPNDGPAKKRKEKEAKDAKDAKDGKEPSTSEPPTGGGAAGTDDDEKAAGPRSTSTPAPRTTSMPKPEVRTSVRAVRDDRDT